MKALSINMSVSIILILVLASCSSTSQNTRNAQAWPGTPRVAGTSSVDCGNDIICPDGYSCCWVDSSVYCCPSDTPHFCLETMGCYRTAEEAQEACGNNWVVCGVPY